MVDSDEICPIIPLRPTDKNLKDPRISELSEKSNFWAKFEFKTKLDEDEPESNLGRMRMDAFIPVKKKIAEYDNCRTS